MADAATHDNLFPRLDDVQIARLAQLGRKRKFETGDIIFEQGQTRRGFFVLIEGHVEILSPSEAGETLVALHTRGQFTGELDLLTGRRSLVRARAATPSELLEIDVQDLRHIVQADAELSEIFL